MRIAHLLEFSFTETELASFERTELAGLCLLGHITNEVSIYQRLTLQAFKNCPDAPEVEDAYRVYVFFLLRGLAAKVLEASDGLDKLIANLRKEKLTEQAAILERFSEQHRKFKRGHKMKMAKELRNKVTSHYDLDAIEDQIAAKGVRPPFKAYIHNTACNSFFPFAEDYYPGLFTMGGLEAHDRPVEAEELNEFLAWTLDFAKFFQSVFAGFLMGILGIRLPGRGPRKITPYFESQHGFEENSSYAPLFIFSD